MIPLLRSIVKLPILFLAMLPLFLFLFPVLSSAQPGTLDLNFGSAGIVITPIGSGNDVINSMLIQSDGKILTAGYSNVYFTLVRYQANGSPDSTFGNNGIVTTLIGTGNGVGNSVAMQSDGKIVLAGLTGIFPDFSIAVARYDTNGLPDSTFDSDGKVITNIGSTDDRARDVAIQPDGKILIGGNSFNGTNNDLLLMRYLADGSPDSTFDSDGIVTTPVGTANDIIRTIALQSDGKIVVGGFSFQSGSLDYEFLIGRYDSTGMPDSAFDSDGLLTMDMVTANDYGESLLIQGDGKIVLGGYNYDGFISLLRCNSDGSMDSTFGASGKVSTAFGASYQNDYSVAIQADGKFIIAGYRNTDSTNSRFGMARYNNDGSLDTVFGVAGFVSTQIGFADDIATTAAIQSDGKIVLAGKTYNGSNYDFAIARYHADFPVTAEFDFTGPPQFLLYPNPSEGTFDLLWTGDDNATLSIFDLHGHEMMRRSNLGSCEFQIQIPGIYFVVVNDGVTVRTRQLQIR